MMKKFAIALIAVFTFGLSAAHASYWCQISRVSSCTNWRTSVELRGVYSASEAAVECRRYAQNMGQFMCQVSFRDDGGNYGEYYCQLSRGANCSNYRYSFPTGAFNEYEARKVCRLEAHRRGELFCQVRIP